jgi:hypothetical protein
MIPENNLRALKLIADKLAGKQIIWALIGSTNLALQGVDVETHDIDLLTTKEGALEIAKLFKEYETEPVKYSESEYVKSYRGIFTIGGVRVDVAGDMQHKTSDGNWVSGTRLTKLITLKVRDFTLPAMDLKHEHQAYLSMGRIEKAKKIKEVLDRKKPKDEF